MQTDVLVVGAGPTGLMLATELGLAGVAPVVIDALPTPSGQAKGTAVQPRTAEVFDLRGMMDLLLRATTTIDLDVTAALLRPDGHICWLTSAAQRRDPTSADLHVAIEQWFAPGVTKRRAGSSPL